MLGGVAELVTPKARAIGHALMWGVNFGLFTAAAFFFANKTQTSRKHIEPTINRWGPFALVVLGALMIMCDLTRHVILDLNDGPEWLAMYSETGLSVVGRTGLILTYGGCACFALGLAWFADVFSQWIPSFKEESL